MALLDPNEPKDRQTMITLWNAGARIAPGYHPSVVHAVRDGEDETLCENPSDHYAKMGTMEDPEQVTCTKCYEILIGEIALEEG